MLFAAYKKIACLNLSERGKGELVTRLTNRVAEQWPFHPPDFVSQCDMTVPYIWLVGLVGYESIASASSISTPLPDIKCVEQLNESQNYPSYLPALA